MFQLTHCTTPHIVVEQRNLRKINNLRENGMIDVERQQFFWSRTRKEDGHLIWTGSYSSRRYGFMYFPGDEKIYAHRVSYCIAKGLDLKDVEEFNILRTCDRNDCVAPEHLVAKKKKLNK